MAVYEECETEIGFITLVCRNLQTSAKFYQHAFGLEVKSQNEGMLLFKGGLSFAIISQKFADENLPLLKGLHSYRNGQSSLLSLHCKKEKILQQIIEKVENYAGKIVKQKHITAWGQTAAFVKDPDGYIWEIVLR